MKKIIKKLKIKMWISKKEEKIKRNFILQTILDIVLLFKNFIHWNISKLIINIYSVLVWFIFILPLIIIFIIYTFFSDVNVSMLISWMLSWELLYDLFWNILLVLIVVVYFIVFSYSNILLFRVNNKYIDWKQLKYKNKIFLDFKRLFKFIKLSLLNLLILSIPLVIFAILIMWLFMISGSINNVLEIVKTWVFNYFTVFSLLFWLIALISFAYLYYKIVFSYLLFSDDKVYDSSKKVSFYIKKSFKITKWIKKILKFSTLIIIFILLILPFNYIWKILDNNWKYLSDYIYYTSVDDNTKTNIKESDVYYYNALELKFQWKDIVELRKDAKMNLVYDILFNVFNFLFIYWLFIMIFSSFYRRELV
jgi:hypothetical protein